ncbi:MAG: hypothetical protein E7663_00305 [Ruminococcaceae bacterium]|nr:hypothetical protein [Oscillospiraceae bacterium]
MKKHVRLLLLVATVVALLVLTAVMASAATPYQVEGGSSYATLAEAVSAVPAGGTITLTADVTENSMVTLNRAITYTIDFSTHTVTFSAKQGLLVSEGTVTVRGGVLTQSSSLYTGTTDAIICVAAANDMTLTIDGTTFRGGCSQLNLTNTGKATVNIYNAVFGDGTDPIRRALINCNNGSVPNADTLNIHSGTFTNNVNLDMGMINAAGMNVNIYGGTFTSVYGKNIIRLADADRVSVVSIEGGSFTMQQGGIIIDLTSPASNHGEVTITGGTFTGGSRQIDVGGQNELTISASTKVAGEPRFGLGTVTDAVIGTRNAGDQSINGVRDALVTVNGGTFILNGIRTTEETTDSDGKSEDIFGNQLYKVTLANYRIFHLAGGDCVINGGTFTLTDEGVDDTGVNFPGTGKPLEQRIFNMDDNDVISDLTIKGGTFTTSAHTVAIVYYAARHVDRADIGKLPSISISGGEFHALLGGRILDLSAGKSGKVTVEVSDGVFEGKGDCLIWVSLPSATSTLSITGGTFTLLENESLNGGAILRTGSNTYVDSTTPLTDPTKVHFASAVSISITGGLFIDDRSSNDQIVDASVGTSNITVGAATLLSRYAQPYFVKAASDAQTISMTRNTLKYFYLTEEYYAYTASTATDPSKAPTMREGATIRVVTDEEGIRFTSSVPNSFLATLSSYELHTIIAPVDFVNAAGAFTKAALEAYAQRNYAGDTSRVFVDIKAENSIAVSGDVTTFNGCIIKLRTVNYDRDFAAISYVLDKGTGKIYYGAYDPSRQVRSFANVAAEALSDTKTSVEGNYTVRSVLKTSEYSPYTSAAQNKMMTVAGLGEGDVIAEKAVTVGSSWGVVYASGASANLVSKINAMASSYGITTINGSTMTNEILIGKTGRTETNTALARISGNGYFVGIIGNKIVAVGTTNLLTMTAVDVLMRNYSAGSLQEALVCDLPLLTLNADTSFMFSRYRDGNLELGYEWGYNHDHYFSTSNINTEYAAERNEEAVDYPVYAAARLAEKLLGASEQSGVTALFNIVPDALNANGLTIHVGLTSDAATAALLKDFGTDINGYGYTIRDNKIVIASYNDQSLRKAIALFTADLADFKEGDIYCIPEGYEVTKTDTYTSDWASGFPLPSLQLSGALDVHADTYQYYYTGEQATLSAFEAYCSTLVGQGYTAQLVNDNVEGSYFRTYMSSDGKLSLHVMYTAYRHASTQYFSVTGSTSNVALDTMFSPAIRVIVTKVGENSILTTPPAKLQSLQTFTPNSKVATARLTSVQLKPECCGNCYIYALEDGSFIVLDGGGSSSTSSTNSDAEHLYKVLEKMHTEISGSSVSKSNPIRIAAWYISHSHNDHHDVFYKFCQSYTNSAGIFGFGAKYATIDYLIANFASDDEVYNVYDPNIAKLRIPFDLENSSWPTDMNGKIKYLKVHTGQKLWFANAELEVLYTHEDVYPWSLEYYNNTSTVIRFNIYDTNGTGTKGECINSGLWLGDLQYRGSQTMRAMYGDYLKSDMVQIAHHGGNGSELELYKLVNAEVIWWPHSSATVKAYAKYRDSYSENQKVSTGTIEQTDWKYLVVLEGYDFQINLSGALDTDFAGATDYYNGETITEGTYYFTPSSMETFRRS